MFCRDQLVADREQAVGRGLVGVDQQLALLLVACCDLLAPASRSRSMPYVSTASLAPPSGSAQASFQPLISASRNALTISGRSSMVSSVAMTLSATNGRPLSANSRLATVEALRLRRDRLVGDVGDEAVDLAVDERRRVVARTGTIVTSSGSMSLAASRASNEARLPPSWTPIFLPIRSCGRRDVAAVGQRQDRERVLLVRRADDLERDVRVGDRPGAVETALLRPKSALPVATSVLGARPGPAMKRRRSPKPASV